MTTELTTEALALVRPWLVEVECVECGFELLAAPNESEPRCLDCEAVAARRDGVGDGEPTVPEPDELRESPADEFDCSCGCTDG